MKKQTGYEILVLILLHNFNHSTSHRPATIRLKNNNSDSLDEYALNILLDLYEPNTNP